MQDDDARDLVDLLDNFKITVLKLIYKTKRDSKGNIERFSTQNQLLKGVWLSVKD